MRHVLTRTDCTGATTVSVHSVIILKGSCVWALAVGKLTCPFSPALVHLRERKQEMGYCELFETERKTTDTAWMYFLLEEMQLIDLAVRKQQVIQNTMRNQVWEIYGWCAVMELIVRFCVRVSISVMRTFARVGALSLLVHKHQDERQSEQSQDAGCYGQGHCHRS